MPERRGTKQRPATAASGRAQDRTPGRDIIKRRRGGISLAGGETQMTDKTIEQAIEVPVEFKQAIERAAAARGVSVPDFLEDALRKLLADTGYIDEEGAD